VTNYTKGTSLSFGAVITTVLFMLVFIFLFAFITGLGKTALDVADNSNCKSTVFLAAKTGGLWRGDPIDCPTNFVEFKNVKSRNIDDVKKRIAEGTADCWDKFGEGKLQLFPHEATFPERGGGDIVEYCNVCEVYEFDNVPQIEHFGEYLSEEKVPQRFDDEQRTYLEYLSNVAVREEKVSEYESGLKEIDIDTSKPYMSLFVYTKDPSFFKTQFLLDKAFEGGPIKLLWYGGLALMLGRPVGAQWNSLVLVAPYDKSVLQKVCVNLQE
jgi:hypothetical protein